MSTPAPHPTTPRHVQIDRLINTWLLVARHDLSAPFPSRGSLVDLVVASATLERDRIERELRALYIREVPLLFRSRAEAWVKKVEDIINDKEGNPNGRS